ncbi:glycosyltransferase [Fluviibacter phosphoraccumulans]
MAALRQRLESLPKSLYAIGQLGLLGLPSVLFIPLLLRWVDVDVVATLLVAQVYVYYLVMLQQFGFNLTGPARLGVVGDTAHRGILGSTLRFKSALLLVNTLAWGAIVYTIFDGALTLLVFLALLMSYVLNSNWYLQSRHDFYTGALSAGLGVAGGLAVLVLIWQSKHNGIELDGILGWAVLAMIAPQMMVGIGSFLRALRLAASNAAAIAWPAREIWAQGWPLMIAQLLLLATTTLGTVVVGHVTDSDVTAAYAATEKIFNLAATVVVALFAIVYPGLARLRSHDVSAYWRRFFRVNLKLAVLGWLAAGLLSIAGPWLFGIYLGDALAALVVPVLVPFALWLSLVPFQNALQCHLTIINRTRMTIGLAIAMLALELGLGLLLVQIAPVYWVYGMLLAQLPAVLALGYLWAREVSQSQQLEVLAVHGHVTVMHVISGLTVGGAEIMLYRVATQCGSGQIRHTVVSMSDLGAVGQQLQAAGVPVFSLNIPNGHLTWAGVRDFRKLLKEQCPDVVQTWMFHADFFAGLLARLFSDIPVIWNIRQSDTSDDKFVKRVLALVLNPVLSYFVPDRIICCGEAIKTVYARKGYCPWKLISVPNGCDTVRYQAGAAVRAATRERFDLAGSDLAVGVVGRFHIMKDHECFVRAMGLLRAAWPQTVAVFCGEGLTADNAELVGWLQAAGFPLERCRFLGRQTDMPQIYPMLDVLVSSSRSGEGFPNVLVEGMACGVTCVTTDVGCSREIVGEAAQVLTPGQPEKLATAISCVLEDVVRDPVGVSASARARVVQNFSFDRTMTAYEQLYYRKAHQLKLMRAA